MARGFLTGLLWGVVTVAAGLVVLSQMAPLPVDLAAPQTTGSAVNRAAADKIATDQAASEQAAADKAAADKAAVDKAAVDKAAVDKAATDKAATDKAAAVKVAAQAAADNAAAQAAADKVAAAQAVAGKAAGDKAAAARAAADKAAADKAAADTTATVKADADKAVAEKAAAQTAADKAAVDEAAAARAAADKAAAGKAAADKAAADKVAAEKAAADKAAVAQAAAAQAAAARTAATQAAADKAAVAQAAAAQAAAAQAAAARTAATQAAADKAAAAQAATQAAAAQAAAAQAAAAQAAATQAAAARTAAAVPPAASAEPPIGTKGDPGLTDPEAPAADGSAPSLTALDQALTVPEAEAAPAASEPAPPAPDGPKDTLLIPGQPAGQAEPARLPQIAPVADPEVVAVAPDVVAEPAADTTPARSPASTLKNNQPTLPPTQKLQDKLPTGLRDKVVAGVRTDQLPQIGAKPAEPAATASPPVQLFARPFQNPASKPLFVILLHDVGAAGVSREELSKLPFPVSFVVDPLATDARDASAAYRAAGQEVLTLANGIPPGATAADLETTFQTLSSILPESVAVIDQDIGGFQDQRALATLVLPVIKGEGRGLVTYDRGLNAADQIARRAGVPDAVIFRRLDGEDESKSTIRRYLDRAAFKAAQDGQVVVIGDTRAETVAAILEWTVEGKAATVALAPVTAVLGR